MLRTFQYRLRPTKSQRTTMRKILEECRWLWNHLLEQRKTSWEEEHKGLTFFEQAISLPKLKHERPSLKTVYAQSLQQVAVRIDLAFKAFFRRCKASEKPGYPRFRGKGRYDSFTYPQMPSGAVIRNGYLALSKVGLVKIVLHRPLEGMPKTCTIRRTATGKWFATIVCEVEAELLPISDEQVGIDVGLTAFATLSTGEKIENPRFFRKGEKALARAQRRMAKEAKGTPQRHKCRKVVSRIHERVTNKRKDFAHQQSRKIVNRFGVICVEDINASRMVHNHCLAKSILDAAWSDFLRMITYKAAWAGRRFVAINPAYTTQDCCECGHRQIMPLSERVYRCPCCGSVKDRDHNAALNILTLGLQSLGLAAPKGTCLQGE